MVIQHNLSAMNAQRRFKITTGVRAKSAEKLGSGYRINRAADDAAGLAISEKMRRDIRGLAQGTENLMDGISVCQIADGALNEVHDILNRLSELSIKGGNDTLTDDDRSYIESEAKQLVNGLDDIFITTEFNENYIFRSNNAPNVTGNPNDIQIFNSSTGTPGGVLINHKRYTFNELGINLESDSTFADNKVEFTLDNGEKVELYTTSGSALNDIHRVYRWSADETGISINDVRAVTWSDLGVVDGSTEGSYSFGYHGMTISFTAEDNNLRNVIAGINGDGLDDISWETTSPMTTNRRAVTMSYSDTAAITNANKDKVHPDGSTYTVRADADGIWIHDDIHDTNTTKTAWGSFATATGQYPITDWGRQGDSGNDVTLDYDETYTYTGNFSDTDSFYRSVSLNFKIMDEASQQAVIAGLNGQSFSVKNVAELTGTAGGDSTVTSHLSFGFQRDNGRDFDAASGTNAFSGDTFDIVQNGTATADSFSGTISISINGKTFTSDQISGDTANNSYISNVNLYLEGDRSEYLTIDKYYFGNPDQTLELKATDKMPSQTLSTNSAYTTDAETRYAIKVNAPMKEMIIQVSSELENYIEMKWNPMNSGILGVGGLLFSSSEASIGNIEAIKAAQALVSEERMTFGSYQNRFEHSVRNNQNSEENTQAAESLIRDTDMAHEMQHYSNTDIIAQAGQMMMAQANQSKQGVLNLLQ